MVEVVEAEDVDGVAAGEVVGAAVVCSSSFSSFWQDGVLTRVMQVTQEVMPRRSATRGGDQHASTYIQSWVPSYDNIVVHELRQPKLISFSLLTGYQDVDAPPVPSAAATYYDNAYDAYPQQQYGQYGYGNGGASGYY